MQVSAQRTSQQMWLPLLMVFVLCAIVICPDCLAEIQQQKIELDSESEPSSSEDDTLMTGFKRVLIANKFLSFSLIFPERPSHTGCDDYPGTILHGPPSPHHPV
jgi:hypothetical protein